MHYSVRGWVCMLAMSACMHFPTLAQRKYGPTLSKFGSTNIKILCFVVLIPIGIMRCDDFVLFLLRN